MATNNPIYTDSHGKIYHGSCYDILPQLGKESVHLTVTSPPYDKMRDYDKYPKFDIVNYGKMLYDVTVPGGVCAIVIQDQTVKVKTGTSVMLAADFIRECGWNLFETAIYQRHGVPGKYWNSRFRVDHEYIHIFVKGDTPQYFNKDHLKVPAIYAGKKMRIQKRKKTGDFDAVKTWVCNDTKCRGTIWDYRHATSSVERNLAKNLHPATFPDKLAADVIRCFSKEGDMILDPMCGSGTTAVMAKDNNRQYIGIEYSENYIKDCIIPRLSANKLTDLME